MLNAYSRVDKGRLFALDRGDDKSAFGPHISDAFELFKNLKKSQKDADGDDHGPESDGFVRETKGSPTAAEEDDTDNSVIVSDTLLSNLLISSVLSALKAGNNMQEFLCI